MTKNIFQPASLIKKKRSGEALSREELSFLIQSYTNGALPDYQMSAFLMAVYFQGMNAEEGACLVELMLHSGKVLDFSSVKGPKIDKHSTGGIGDKTTLVLAPLLASCGIHYPTIAGRGLAHTGGTIDKLEAIPGFNCFLPLERFKELVSSVGLGFLGQTEEICPADRKLYALRDVTATVESVPLIVGSILSKKLAEGIDGILFDVKTGSGAFMKSQEEAKNLAKALVNTAKKAGKSARALVTDMNQPLGRMAGNANEVNECVAFLRQGPQDEKPEARLYELTMRLATEMYVMAKKISGEKTTEAQAKVVLEEALSSGKAYAKFLEIVSLQGGDTEALDQGLPLAKKKFAVKAKNKGYLRTMDAEKIGLALIELGGGRKVSADKIIPGAGLEFFKRLGEPVKAGEELCLIYAQDAKSAENAEAILLDALQIGGESKVPPLVWEKIDG